MKSLRTALAVILVMTLYGCSPGASMQTGSSSSGNGTAAETNTNMSKRGDPEADSPGETMKNEMNTRSLTHAEKAAELYDRIQELYAIRGLELYLEHYPLKPDDRAVSFLWPFSGLLSAVNAMGSVPELKDGYEGNLKLMSAVLEKYRDDLRQPPAYQSYPFEYGGDDRFYDDNMWLGLDFVDAFEHTGDKQYLEKSRELFRFIQSGWSEELGGGIFWCEQKKESKNTCSNGPAAVLALKLYKVTGEKEFLDWGLEIYNWTRENLRAPEDVYWDNVNLDGTTDRSTYAYNTGTMLHSAVLLYQITGDAAYLEEAKKLAAGSLRHFAPEREKGIRFFSDENPWFTVVLLRGYQALYEVDGDPEYVDAVIAAADYGWQHAMDANGLLSRDWSGESSGDRDSKWLLDEACMVELYARAAQLKNQ